MTPQRDLDRRRAARRFRLGLLRHAPLFGAALAFGLAAGLSSHGFALHWVALALGAAGGFAASDLLRRMEW